MVGKVKQTLTDGGKDKYRNAIIKAISTKNDLSKNLIIVKEERE